ncbi:conserved hypothetical protein [Nostocoides australiense Ben110]|uniref:Uncharacterized protein n=1 Tax=Nostocoides australiense Ben110 TaxID=1193182 RepID=W6JTB8_9MICO|nr:hypothetical protein [Tetrasphaera australiensis]CCH71665.1 conserved hypothetical protein [Tetrasphaera australiensis Ben110]
MNPAVSPLAARLPTPATVARWWVSVTAFDAILGGEWASFAFDPEWGEKEHCATYRSGSGDDASVTFTARGAFLRGFDHECALSPWGRDGVRSTPEFSRACR